MKQKWREHWASPGVRRQTCPRQRTILCLHCVLHLNSSMSLCPFTISTVYIKILSFLSSVGLGTPCHDKQHKTVTYYSLLQMQHGICSSCGRRGGLMVSALDSGSSGLDLSAGLGYCVRKLKFTSTGSKGHVHGR